ncbi:DUF1107 family protein [Ferrimonas gelatinilytica]|uniref:DUF1107 family protein n=1 Tax=Ferrimonas gelatinilytica TaxID=1255257 RepID=UPI0031EECA5A
MRSFPVYAPRIIAKHARILRHGNVVIKDLGQLEFRESRFVMPRHCQPQIRAAVTELNSLLNPQLPA